MRLEVRNVRASLSGSGDELGWAREYLSYEEQRFVKHRGRSKRLSPAEHSLLEFDDTMPAGLVPSLVKAAAEDGLSVEVVDVRVPPWKLPPEFPETWPWDGGLVDWLYAYQRNALRIALERRRGILWLPTGSGKTEIAVALAMAVPVRWLFLTHRKGLLEQSALRFERRAGEQAGRVGDGKWDRRRFTVATFQTVSRALSRKDARGDDAREMLAGAHGLVVDEAHCLPALSFVRVAELASGAYWRVGLSGTPVQRSDKRSMFAFGALGPILYRLKPGMLIEEGVLARPVIRMVKVRQDDVSLPTWQGVYGKGIARSTVRNLALVELVRRADKPALVFVKELKHGLELTRRLLKGGVRAEFVRGQHSIEWRSNLLASLVRGDIDALVSTVVMQDGIDVPELASVVVGSGGKSAIATLQRLGRGGRSDGGRKLTFQVWDIADKGNAMLDAHSKERRKAYESEGYAVEEVDL